jgi:type IV pilus assembly protein PilW
MMRSTNQRQGGFTLVELMVGLTIGLIVVTALLVLFANASSTGQNLGRSSEQIENGRYVSELLREDIRLAGMYGEMPDSPTPPVYTNPDPCLTTPTGFVNSPFGLPAPVQGFKPADVVACLTNRKAGTSAIAIRRLSVDTTPTASVVAGANQYYVQYSFCKSDPSGTLLIFNKTSASFTLKNFACTATNPVRAYVSRVYYIADCNVCGTDTTPTLKRLELIGNTTVITPLAEGIEELRFEYGFDTDGDGSTDTYLTDSNSPAVAGATSLWENVMTVKVHFIVRSLQKVGGGPSTAAATPFLLGNAASAADPGDGYSRRVYSTTIRLNNPSGARETP